MHVRRSYDANALLHTGTPVLMRILCGHLRINSDPPVEFYVVNQAVSYVCDPQWGAL